MNQHTYLRAYLAGIAVPTVFLLVVMTGYSVLRYVYNFPVPVERVIVFPMAVVPNLWGLWNVFFIALHNRFHHPIGLHGAILPIFLAPMGLLIAGLLNFPVPLFVTRLLPYLAPVAIIAYYLAWKYLVGFLNRMEGIS
jgi:hypothetical protein